jgi:predicted nucleotidyltransferase
MNADDPVERVVAIIRDQYKPQRIILFGSRVWGGADVDSDLDMLVIKETAQRETERICEVLQFVDEFQRRPHLLPLDILVKTPEEIEERLRVGDEFIREILDRGRVAYERPVV